MQNMKNLLLRHKILLGGIILTLIIALASYSSKNADTNKINNLSETVPSTEKLQASNEVVSHEDETVITNKEVINILLIGQDRRPNEDRARSDSMIIATINKHDKTIKLISLMRDMYVQIPGYSDNKINAAYALGGMELLDDTIEKNFLVHIDGNVEVDFEQFTKIIDKIGGIDIKINERETEYLNTDTNWNLSAGICHMTGDVALKYSRTRYVGNDDYERTERQRKVLSAAFKKIKDSSLITILTLADDILSLINTDISSTNIIGYITGIMSMGEIEVETYRIPADGEFTIATIREMSVLVPDLSDNRALLKEYIWGNQKD
jgi:LCP family protein required for cell wall assembly